jgi:hypothetical protein
LSLEWIVTALPTINLLLKQQTAHCNSHAFFPETAHRNVVLCLDAFR